MSKHAVNADDIISRSTQGTRFMQVAYYDQVPVAYEPNQLVTAAYVDSRTNSSETNGEYFQEVEEFTYDGTNNNITLAFPPKKILSVQLNGFIMNPYRVGDFSITDSTITIDSENLQNGIQYVVLISYFK